MADKKNEDFVVRMPDVTFEKNDRGHFAPRSQATRSYGRSSTLPLSLSAAKLDNSPPASVLAYCAASISMTIVNKYVVSGKGWNVNFFYLTVQVCLQDLSTSRTRNCVADSITDRHLSASEPSLHQNNSGSSRHSRRLR